MLDDLGVMEGMERQKTDGLRAIDNMLGLNRNGHGIGQPSLLLGLCLGRRQSFTGMFLGYWIDMLSRHNVMDVLPTE